MFTNWQLFKIGFFIAFGWWIAAMMSNLLDFGLQAGFILLMAAVAQVS